MGRKPNYRFERAERDRLKAAKAAQKAEAKRAERDRERDGDPAAPQSDAQPSPEEE